MADTVYINVAPDFNIHAFAAQLAEKYRMEGFNVTVADFNGAQVITFDKNTGGINMLLGLGQGIKATCMYQNGVLSINFSDGDWTGKIIGLVVGWFLCLIPFITAIVGCFKQVQLPKDIGNDAMLICSSMNQQPFDPEQAPYQPQQPPYQQPQEPYQQAPYQQPYQQPQQPPQDQQQPPQDPGTENHNM